MAKKKKIKTNEKNGMIEIKGIIIISISLLLFAFIYTNAAGIAGNKIKFVGLGLLSIYVYIIPIMLLMFGVNYLIKKGKVKQLSKYILSFFLLLFFAALTHTLTYKSNSDMNITDTFKDIYLFGQQHRGGGLAGGIIGEPLISMFGRTGSSIILITCIIISILLLTKISIVKVLEIFLSFVNNKKIKIKDKRKQKKETVIEEDIIPELDDISEKSQKGLIDSLDRITDEDLSKAKQLNIEDIIENDKPKEEKGKKAKCKDDDKNEKIQIDKSRHENYAFPPIELLKIPAANNNRRKAAELKDNAYKLVEALKSFGVDAKVINVESGPTVTRYELQPSAGVKVSKIVNLADDIALNLAASGIRIEAPIPGKAAIGIEVPNNNVVPVLLREVVGMEDFERFPSKVAFALGKDISGKPVITDISKMPHLLIAGATGSGKSVCINTLITSIIYKATPEEVKLVLIDPKVVELGVYNGIPHLLIPVVTDPKKAASSLYWAVQEMTNRYNLFAERNVRDINAYNIMANEEKIEKLPHIVIVIDELSDLMMVAPDDVENYITRLAQMARAAGMHIVIATQRPSVDVITGVIKANIPSRISFAVSSQVDSRTILDMAGAEKLLGRGDMLFYPIGANKPVRIQGAFISDAEVEKVVNFIKLNSESEYKDDVLEIIENESEVKDVNVGEEADELLSEAIELVVSASQASISMLQRRFRIGYARAARLIDEMELRGIVGGFEGSKPRQVLISKEQWAEMKINEQ